MLSATWDVELMGGIATDEQSGQIVRAADRHLYDPNVGGYRLNSDFGPAAERLSMSLGRCFGFAFGHKENGAMFSHMAVMYANALYRRGLVREADGAWVAGQALDHAYWREVQARVDRPELRERFENAWFSPEDVPALDLIRWGKTPLLVHTAQSRSCPGARVFRRHRPGPRPGAVGDGWNRSRDRVGF